MAAFYVAIFAEGDFERVEPFDHNGEAHAYARGLTDGGELYGAGSCSGYVLPDDDETMREHEIAEEVALAIKALEKTREGR